MAGKKLLVADDSLTIQKVIRLALSNEGYEIQTVSDGDDAVQQISLFRPDIVLIDVSLPGQSAFDVKRAVNTHEDLAAVRFVLMSSAFEKIDEKQLATLVFDGRLTKPFDPAHLRQVLAGVLSRAAHQTGSTTPIPTAPIPTALVTPPPQAPLAIPPRPSAMSAGVPSAAPTAPPPPAPPSAPSPPQFTPPPAAPPAFSAPQEIPDFSTENVDDGPTAPPPGLIAEEDNYGPKYVPAPPSTPDESTQPFLNPFQGRPQGSPQHSSKSDSLWDDHDTGFDLPPAPPPPPPPPPAPPARSAPAAAAPESGDDIRHLTESTIRMSGLDDFEWTVNEPSLKPPPAFGDSPNLQPLTGNEEATQFISASDSDHLPPITTGSFTPPPPPGRAAARPGRQSAPMPTASATTPLPAAPAQASFGAPSLDSAEIENIIRKQVQETLEKLAQKILPEVAEKVIKQEIHRMLSEMP